MEKIYSNLNKPFFCLKLIILKYLKSEIVLWSLYISDIPSAFTYLRFGTAYLLRNNGLSRYFEGKCQLVLGSRYTKRTHKT